MERQKGRGRRASQHKRNRQRNDTANALTQHIYLCFKIKCAMLTAVEKLRSQHGILLDTRDNTPPKQREIDGRAMERDRQEEKMQWQCITEKHSQSEGP